MEQILTTFGIDWRLLAIHGANFGLLMALLWYFLYTPVLRMLEERRRTVTEGVEAAQKAQHELRDIESSRKSLLAQAGKEADEVLAQARASGAHKERELLARGEAAAEALVRDAQLQAREAQAEALRRAKEETAKLVVLGVEKMLQEAPVRKKS